MNPTWTHEKLSLYHADCMEVMRQFPDKHFHLAIVDPPYGIGAANSFFGTERRGNTMKCAPGKYAAKNWDSKPPPPEYFIEVKRVSENQIIWGGNYFGLPASNCWIVWDKDNGDVSFSDAELAWTSFQSAVRIFKWRWVGMLQQDMANKEERIHPTQKPVALYRWLLAKYAQPGQRILDTHLGSGSHAIAAHYADMDFAGIELDADYFKAACERIERETSQLIFAL